MKPKFIHPTALLCFLLAFAFYVTAWSSTAVALAGVGILFELVAWAVWLGDKRGGG
jgi:hypothetical protein